MLVAKQVRNDNVMAIEGVQIVDGVMLCIVSEWMEHGNMHTYLEKNKAADHAELVSSQPHSPYPTSDPWGVAARRDKGS